jgi:hypothetical protein
MFRALTCPSSEGKILFNTASGILNVCKRLHSTHFEGGLESALNRCTVQPLQRATITDAV